MDDQKGKRLVIVDGRYVGYVDNEHILFEKQVSIEDTVELVSAAIPQPTPQGIAITRVCTLHPLAMTQGPKRLNVRYSTILFADTDLDDQERKELETQFKNCLENARRSRLHRSSGLVLPGG